MDHFRRFFKKPSPSPPSSGSSEGDGTSSPPWHGLSTPGGARRVATKARPLTVERSISGYRSPSGSGLIGPQTSHEHKRAVVKGRFEDFIMTFRTEKKDHTAHIRKLFDLGFHVETIGGMEVKLGHGSFGKVFMARRRYGHRRKEPVAGSNQDDKHDVRRRKVEARHKAIQAECFKGNRDSCPCMRTESSEHREAIGPIHDRSQSLYYPRIL